ncbi:MAG: KamA family radical SAM protein, partial [Desulfovibrionaceae bacterium]
MKSTLGENIAAEPPSRTESAKESAAEPPLKRAFAQPERSAKSRTASIDPRSAFYRAHFPGSTRADWNDWRWQIRNRITSVAAAERFLHLSSDEYAALTLKGQCLPLSVTPYYASLLDPDDPSQAVRRCVMPTLAERLIMPGEAMDPLGEDHDSPTEGLVHRYPDRVLFLATGFCSTYCRYCTRSRAVGGHKGLAPSKKRWERDIAYIEAHPEVRDVLISGGDPLTMPDDQIEWLLSRLRRIPHVEMLRIGSKVPAVLPQRITTDLCKMLKRYHPLFISLHFTHPDELTPETTRACERLADAGIPLGSQTVLLSGINDQVSTLKALYHGLLKCRVRPYYLYQ